MHPHRLRQTGVARSLQGGAEIVHAVGGRIMRVRRHGVEHVAPDEVLTTAADALAIGAIRLDDDKGTVDHQERRGRSIEQGRVIQLALAFMTTHDDRVPAGRHDATHAPVRASEHPWGARSRTRRNRRLPPDASAPEMPAG